MSDWRPEGSRMTDRPSKPGPSQEPISKEPNTVKSLISSMCPDDLGLKAGFWTRKEGEPVTFRPIVGWVTVTNFLETDAIPFHAVGLNDKGFPTLLNTFTFPDYIGVFAKALTPQEALAKFAEWDAKREGGPSGGQPQALKYDAGLTLTAPISR
jgi:hypothetical protein